MMPTGLSAAVRACPGREWDGEHCCRVSRPVVCVAVDLVRDESSIAQYLCRCLGLHAGPGLNVRALLRIRIGSVEAEGAGFAGDQQQWRLEMHAEHRPLLYLFERLISGPLEQEMPLAAWSSTLAQHEEPSQR